MQEDTALKELLKQRDFCLAQALLALAYQKAHGRTAPGQWSKAQYLAEASKLEQQIESHAQAQTRPPCHQETNNATA